MFKNGKVNPDNVYELFGSFNGLSAQEVRMHLLEYIYDNIDFFECRSSVCLPICGMDLNTWVDMVEDNCICCDELALLGLSALYQRHCLVVTKNKFWLTIETKEPLSIINLMKECTVRLLYLGNMKFGTLHWQPHNPQPAQPKPNLGQFKIIEEYTLDEPTTSGESSTADNSEAEHVETATPHESAPTAAKPVEQNNKFSPVPVETLTNKNAVKVETLLVGDSKDLLPSDNYPLMKNLKVVVPKLNETDIDAWSDKVHTNYTYNPPHVETELKPMIVSVCGYSLQSAKHQGDDIDVPDNSVNDGEPVPKKAKDSCPLRSGPSPERLLAHANALINKVSRFITKPVDAKYGGKKTIVSSDEKIKRNVEMPSVSTEASQPVETTGSVQGTQDRHTCTIRCKICKESFGSIKELNDHHREDHGVVNCDLCDKRFVTRTALDKHIYTHNNLHFVCEDSG